MMTGKPTILSVLMTTRPCSRSTNSPEGALHCQSTFSPSKEKDTWLLPFALPAHETRAPRCNVGLANLCALPKSTGTHPVKVAGRSTASSGLGGTVVVVGETV